MSKIHSHNLDHEMGYFLMTSLDRFFRHRTPKRPPVAVNLGMTCIVCQGLSFDLGRTLGFWKQKNMKSLNTPPKFNVAPEKWWLEDYFPIGKVTFQGLC